MPANELRISPKLSLICFPTSTPPTTMFWVWLGTAVGCWATGVVWSESRYQSSPPSTIAGIAQYTQLGVVEPTARCVLVPTERAADEAYCENCPAAAVVALPACSAAVVAVPESESRRPVPPSKLLIPRGNA